MKTIYKIPSKVKSLEEKKQFIQSWNDKESNSVKAEYRTLGWFVLLENSYESLYVGAEKPTNLDPGTKVTIMIVPND